MKVRAAGPCLTGLCHHLWVWLAVLCLAPGAVQGESQWSTWFNVEPSHGVDNQSLALIREVFGYDCHFNDILRTECRKVDAGTFPELYPDGDSFAVRYWHDGEYLRVPCDRSGIVCVDEDQAWAHRQLARSKQLKQEEGETTEDFIDTTQGEEETSSANWHLLGREIPRELDDDDSGDNSADHESDGQWKETCSNYEIRFLCHETDSEEGFQTVAATDLGEAVTPGTIMGNITSDGFVPGSDIEVPLSALPAFLKNCTNNTPPPPAFENPLRVNGGFIAMAAGLSVVVPLVCVLIIQLRRAKREEAERRLAEERARGAGSASDGGESGTCDSPPSYEQLFGPDYVPGTTSSLHSRRNSIDLLIEETETSSIARRGRGGGLVNSPSSSTASSSGTGGVSPITVAAGTSSDGGGNTAPADGMRNVGGGPHNNLTFSGSVMSVISETDGAPPSGGEVRGQGADPSLSESEGYVSAPEDGAPVSSPRRRQRQNSEEETASIDPSNTVSLDSGVAASPGSVPPSPTPSLSSTSAAQTSTTSTPISSSSSSTSSSATTATRPSRRRAISTPASSEQPPPPDYSPPSPPPPLPLTPPPPFHARAGETSGEFRLHAVQRRYPNMHLSIQDFISTLRGQQEQERQRRQLQAQRNLQEQITNFGDTPPPSYEEALRILAKARERERSAQSNK